MPSRSQGVRSELFLALLVTLGILPSLGAQGEPVSEPPKEPAGVPAGGASASPGGQGSAAEAANQDGHDGGPLSGSEEPAPLDRMERKYIGRKRMPFWERYVEKDTVVTHALYPLYTHEKDLETGRSSTLLLPFLYTSETPPPAEERSLGLFPLLFFQKSTKDDSYTVSFPFYWYFESTDQLFRYVLPLWLETEESAASKQHVLPPLFTYGRDLEDEATTTRFGIWRILDLWQSRVSPSVTDFSALHLFNWKEETKGGFALFRNTWSDEGGTAKGYTYLFPLLGYQQGSGEVSHGVLPFYAYSRDPGAYSLYLPALLSGYGESEKGYWLGALFPLFGYSSDTTGYGVYSFPLFHVSEGDESERGKENLFAALGILFHTHRQNKREGPMRTYAFLFPLSYFADEPDGSSGSNWFFPYIMTYNRQRLWRLGLPLYWEYSTLSGNGEIDWSFRLGLPLYFYLGTERDHFATVFPLYWDHRSGASEVELFLPFFYGFYEPLSVDLHWVPLFSYRRTPTETKTFIVGPTYINTQYRDYRGLYQGYSHDVLWPLFRIESRKMVDGEREEYRALPFFLRAREKTFEGDSESLFVFPVFHQSSPQSSDLYIAPFYGRSYERSKERSSELTWYPLATYVHQTETDGSGARIHSEEHAFLWWLIATKDSPGEQYKHTHVLPLAFWTTSSPAEDLTIAGPLYFSNRTVENDETDYLDLVLGSLLFSRVVEKEVPAYLPGTHSGGSPLHPLSTAAAGAQRGRVETWRDQGILWPLTRSYRSSDGESGSWLIPFYFNLRDSASRYLALFPLLYWQRDVGPYNLSFFRYFFLFDSEAWRGGLRWSLGQILFDWREDEINASHRLRLLYPLFEYSWDPEGYSLSFTPLWVFSRRGETTENRLFPIFWQGRTTRAMPDGGMRAEKSHFFLFPFYGQVNRSSYQDHFVLFPFFHLRTSPETLGFELWPFFFFRDEPSLSAIRVWPLHADETRASAGDFWVTWFLFLSKRFQTDRSLTYRLDPFLFRVGHSTTESPDGREMREESGFGTLLECLAYDTTRSYGRDPVTGGWMPDETRGEWSFRLMPLALGGGGGGGARLGALLAFYYRDFGKMQIDRYDFWRFFFLTNYLEGADGERFSLLWRLFTYSESPGGPSAGGEPARAGSSELIFLYYLFQHRATATSLEVGVNPLYTYLRDDLRDSTQHSFLLGLYVVETVGGKTTHSLLFDLLSF